MLWSRGGGNDLFEVSITWCKMESRRLILQKERWMNGIIRKEMRSTSITPHIYLQSLKRMEESLVPWDGVVSNPKFLSDEDRSADGVHMIRGSFSNQPYCCIVDTRNDTWFSLDRVVWLNRPTSRGAISTISSQSVERRMQKEQPVEKEPTPSGKELYPILPSFLDSSSVKSSQSRTRSLQVHTPEVKV